MYSCAYYYCVIISKSIYLNFSMASNNASMKKHANDNLYQDKFFPWTSK